MQELLDNVLFLFQRFNWTSVFDILLVSFVFALLLYILRDTEAVTLLRGIFLVVVLISILTSLVNLRPKSAELWNELVAFPILISLTGAILPVWVLKPSKPCK